MSAEGELPVAGALPNPLRDPLGIYERHGRWMLAALAFGIWASLLLWSCSDPSYFAEATVVVTPRQLSERIVDPGLEDRGRAVTEALAAEVLSRQNLAQLVADFGLYPELQGVETQTEIVERVRSHVTIRGVQRLEVEPGAPGDAGERAYSIGFEAATPEAAAGVANRLASLFAETSSAGRLEERQRTTDFLRKELADAEKKLDEQTAAIAEFKERNRARLPDDLEANLERMKTLDDRRSSLSLAIAQAGSQAATLAVGEDASPKQRLARMREELSRMRVNRTDRHPDVIALERQIADLEQRVKSGKQRSPQSSLQISAQALAVLRDELAGTEAELATLDQQIRGMPTIREELEALEERAVILRENRLEVLRKVQNAELGGKLLDAPESRRVTVLNPAEPPSRAMRTPVRKLALSLVASFGLAAAVGVALELLQPVVLSHEDLRSVSGHPILGWVTRIR
jgi:uncharacterized protein involved in exopolysaccharide biosynthesis